MFIIFSLYERLEGVLPAFKRILVSAPVYITIPMTQSVFLKWQPRRRRLLNPRDAEEEAVGVGRWSVPVKECRLGFGSSTCSDNGSEASCAGLDSSCVMSTAARVFKFVSPSKFIVST